MKSLHDYLIPCESVVDRIFRLNCSEGNYAVFSDNFAESNNGLLCFEAKAKNDILISLHHNNVNCVSQSDRDDIIPDYEILIGGWMNTKSAIRKKGCLKISASKSAREFNVINDTTEFCRYWILFFVDYIVVGRNNVGGDVILSWRDSNVKEGIRFVGFASWNTPITIRNVQVLKPSAFVDDYLNCLLPAVDVNGKESTFVCQAFFSDSVIDQEGRLENDALCLKLNDWSCLVDGHAFLMRSDAKIAMGRMKTRNCDMSKFYRNELFSDVKLIVKRPKDNLGIEEDDMEIPSCVIPCHMAVLAMHSKTFRYMFNSNMRESVMKEVVLYEDMENLDLMLKFMYSSRMEHLSGISTNQTIELLIMSDRYGVFVLGKYLKVQLSKCMKIGTVFQILQVANELRLFELRADCLAFIERNFQTIKEKNLTMLFDVDVLKEVVLADELLISSEIQVFEAVFDWIFINREFSGRIYNCNDGKGDDSVGFGIPEASNVHCDIGSVYDLICMAANGKEDEEIDMNSKLLFLFSSNKKRELESLRGEMASASMESEENLFARMKMQFLESFTLEKNFDRLMHLKELLLCVRYALLPLESLMMVNRCNGLIRRMGGDLKDVILNAIEEKLGRSARVSGGGGASDMVISRLKCFRKNRIKILRYMYEGDECGLIYYLGLDKRRDGWQNPYKLKKLDIFCSSPPSKWTSPAAIASRFFVTINYASGDEMSPAWWMIDLGTKMRLDCDHYSIQMDGSGHLIGDWDLQGSKNLVDWVVLKSHRNYLMPSMTRRRIFSWPVDTNISNSGGFRYLRLIVAGESAQKPHKFSLSGIEFYGHLYECE